MAFAALAAAVALAASPAAHPRQHYYDSDAHWSPDSRRIAFLRDERLVTMTADGRELRRYRCGGDDAWLDARTVVCETHGLLVLADVRSGRVRRLGPGGHGATIAQAAVSPDERTIAFARWPSRGRGVGPGPPSLWTVAANGGALRRLVRGSEPSWSPDGTRIAFATDARHPQIATIGSDGTDMRLVTHARDNARPRWSPDGRWIAFVRANDLAHDADVHVYAAAPDGRGFRDLVEPPGVERHESGTSGFAWAPDSSAIVYDTDNPQDPAVVLEGEAELWVTPLDGSLPHFLIRSGTGRSRSDDYYPDWSPDGRLIAFERLYADPVGDGGVYGSIMVVGADGAGLRRLTR